MQGVIELFDLITQVQVHFTYFCGKFPTNFDLVFYQMNLATHSTYIINI